MMFRLPGEEALYYQFQRPVSNGHFSEFLPIWGPKGNRGFMRDRAGKFLIRRGAPEATDARIFG